jgi:hypothetical protein
MFYHLSWICLGFGSLGLSCLYHLHTYNSDEVEKLQRDTFCLEILLGSHFSTEILLFWVFEEIHNSCLLAPKKVGFFCPNLYSTYFYLRASQGSLKSSDSLSNTMFLYLSNSYSFCSISFSTPHHEFPNCLALSLSVIQRIKVESCQLYRCVCSLAVIRQDS